MVELPYKTRMSRSVSLLEIILTNEGLSPAELRVAVLLAEGLPNREIAKALKISVSGVKFQSGKIYKKLEVKNRVTFLVWCHEKAQVALTFNR